MNLLTRVLRILLGLFSTALYPFLVLWLRIRSRRGKEDSARRSERYGYASTPRPPNCTVVWVHAASVGESISVTPLLRHLSQSNNVRIVFTTGTVTSATIASRELSNDDNIIHQYVPIDTLISVSRFLNHWRPDLVIFAESEIWPTTVLELSRRRIPQLLVNARMSDRSHRRWSSVAWLSRPLFGSFLDVLAQSDLDADRFRQLGSLSARSVGNLKMDVGVPVVDDDSVSSLREQIGTRPTWLSVSTHDGEERIASLAHRRIAEVIPDILTIIVPRHPDRSSQIHDELTSSGLSVVTRSSGERIDSSTSIFLGDTIGEMGTYLSLSRISFMGKSMTVHGGQNPVESALMGCAILVGPHTSNFGETYAALLDSGGARLVDDVETLSSRIIRLLESPDLLESMCSSARSCVTNMSGALRRTTDILDSHLSSLGD